MVHARLVLRDVDVLPDTNPVAVTQRCDERSERKARRHEVGVGPPRSDRRTIRPAGHVDVPGHGPTLETETDHRRLGSRLASHRGRQHHRPRIPGVDLLPSEAVAGGHAGPEVLDDDIGPIDQPIDHGPGLGLREVAGQAEFALVGVRGG